MNWRARMLIAAGVVLTAIGLAAGGYFFNRLGLYVPNCNFCPGRPVPPDLALLGRVSSLVFAIGGALTVGVIVTELKARSEKRRKSR